MEDVGVNGTVGQRHKSKAVEEVEEVKEEKRGEGKRREKRFQTFEMGKPGVHIVIHHLHKEHTGEVRAVGRGGGDDTNGKMAHETKRSCSGQEEGTWSMEHGVGGKGRWAPGEGGPDVCAQRGCVSSVLVCAGVC